MTNLTGHRAILKQLLVDGVTHIFGNPGTVEQGFLDELRHEDELKYVLTLHESVAVMAADAYARKTKGLGVVQIHSTPGLGNSIGSLYQAMRGASPLLVLGGDAGLRYSNMDAQMAGDLVGMARPVTKWSTMVLHSSSLLRTLRRAIKIATTPPMGPVYVCLPQDVLDEVAHEPIFPSVRLRTDSCPPSSFLDQAFEILFAAKKPRFFVGDGVAWDDAVDELTQLAEIVGAEVWGVDSGDINMDVKHPLWCGQTGHMFGFQSKPITQAGDANLIVGTYMLPEVFPDIGEIFGLGAKTIHVDLDPNNIGKNHPVDVALLGSPKQTLSSLATRLNDALSDERKSDVLSRIEVLRSSKNAAHEEDMKSDEKRPTDPLHFSHFMRVLGPKIPKDAIIYDEALTSSPELCRYIPSLANDAFFQVRGGSLGTAMAGAVGLSIADPERPVIAFSGDGGAMYTYQALWTAARHNLNAKFVICSNRSYRLLQLNLQQFRAERNIDTEDFPLSFDLSQPELRFEKLAAGLGVPSGTIEQVSQIEAAVEDMLRNTGPYLLDVRIAGDFHPDLIGVACGH